MESVTMLCIDNGADNILDSHRKIRGSLSSKKALFFIYFLVNEASNFPDNTYSITSWGVYGTNNINDLFEYINNPECSFFERTEEGGVVVLERSSLAEKMMETMPEEQLFEIIKSLIRDRLIGKI